MTNTQQLWLFNLPLVVVPSLHLATIPMCACMSFFVYKLDEVSAELQNPYGFDASDIALGTINDRLQRDMSQLTLEYDPDRALHTAPFPLMKYSNNGGENPQAGDWADDKKLVKTIGLGNLEQNTKKE